MGKQFITTEEELRAAADKVCDQLLTEYLTAFNARQPAQIAKLLELMISKCARGVEQTSGCEATQDMLKRTARHLRRHPRRNPMS